MTENAYYVYSGNTGLYRMSLDPASGNYLQMVQVVSNASFNPNIFDFAIHPTVNWAYAVTVWFVTALQFKHRRNFHPRRHRVVRETLALPILITMTTYTSATTALVIFIVSIVTMHKRNYLPMVNHRI